MSSLMIPAIYLQIEHQTAVLILLGMTVVSLMIDVLLHYHGATRRLMLRVFGAMLRPHERTSERFLLTGASWVLIAATLTFALFPKVISVTAFTVLIVSDTVAALVGRRYGTRRFLDKSLVGSVSFAISAIGVVAFYGNLFSTPVSFLVCGILASVVAATVEASSTRLKVDDNLSIPFSFAITMVLLHHVVNAINIPSFLG
ncbi:MAG: dolichol kinase [Candidatus Kapabacteria bacterium]|nr:dolichol kinase [Candidatus Kapabacteria bacterium]